MPGEIAHHRDMGTKRGELRDLAAALTGITRRHQLRPGMVIVGLIELPDTIQHLLDTAVLATADRAAADVRDCAARVRDVAERLFGPRVVLGQPRHSFLTVVVRHGPLEFTATDHRWIDGWLQADHGVPVLDAALVLMTEHGWRCADNRRRGYHPALAPYPSDLVS